MPLRCRVAPDGTLHAVAARGTLMGNRGRLHDPATRTLTGRRQGTPAWIACELAFKGRSRAVWGASYTELFFLDEPTALAAGHRPCFECRRAEARAFLAGSGAASAPDLDRRLAPDRPGGGAAPRLVGRAEALALPDGAMVGADGASWAVRGGRALPWGWEGYGAPGALPAEVRVLTPRVALSALGGGYAPRWHPTAGWGGA